MRTELIPAILVKTKKKLVRELNQVKKDVKTVQIDIMDGRFVRNKTIQAEDFEGIKKRLKYEVQLMVKNPIDYLDAWKKAKANLIIFHIEATKNKKDVFNLIKEIKKNKMKVGIGINPKTSAEKIKHFLKKIDLALVMTVQPGAGGRKFMPLMLKKVAKIRKWNKQIDIEVDGGINKNNVCDCILAGANNIVAGSGIFKKSNIHKAIIDIKQKKCIK